MSSLCVFQRHTRAERKKFATYLSFELMFFVEQAINRVRFITEIADKAGTGEVVTVGVLVGALLVA